MRRRDFLTGIAGSAVASGPLSARAQQPAIPVIGYLSSGSPASDDLRLDAVRLGLKELGFAEDRNVTIEYRWADGQYERLDLLAADLVGRRVAVLVAIATAAALAAKRATSTLPVVFLTGGDPVELGLVASLNRPGGNVTGVSFLVNKLVAKRLELLSELAPGATTLGMLVDPNNPNAAADAKDAQEAASAIGRNLLVVKAGEESELDRAFATLADLRISALFVAANANFIIWRDRLMALAARHGIAASYSTRDFVVAGGLMSYGSNLTEVYRQLGVYAGRLLQGARPMDLPVQQSTKFELVINLKTARALGLSVPLTLLALADEVIE
jgi:putative tryptophan/tyrosine transport system substrate-binding protein